MPTLSIAMIVKNEEAHLGHCLASVEGLAEEVVVVDTGSTDRTREIARGHGAKVVEFAWCDDFSAARNESLKHCTGDWILILDADEAIDPVDHAAIRSFIKEDGPIAATLTLRNYFLDASATLMDKAVVPNQGTPYTEGRDLPFYGDYNQGTFRLLRNGLGILYEGRIHESFEASLQRLGRPLGECPAVIHHFGKVLQVRERDKALYYLALAKSQALEEPKNAQAHFNLAIQANLARDWEASLQGAQAYLKLKPHAPYVVHMAAASSLVALGRPKAAIPHLEALIRVAPDHVMALAQMATVQAKLHRPKEARDWFRRAAKAGPTFGQTYLLWAGFEREQGFPEEAKRVLLRGLEANPGDPTLNTALVNLALDTEPMEKAAVEAWAAIQRCPQGGGGHWHHLVAVSLMQQQKAPLAEHILRLGLGSFPDHPGLHAVQEQLQAPHP